MDGFSIAAASGMRSRLESLDMLANNLANTATAGYKADREFYDTFLGELAAAGSLEQGARLPGVQPVIQRQYIDLSQGPLQETGNPHHVALSGPGFFVVESPTGPLYTRNGAFQVSPEGLLTTQEGYPVRMEGGATLAIPPGRDIVVNAHGEIEQDGLSLGRFEIVHFADTSGLDKQGSSYFRQSNPDIAPEAAPDTAVRQRMLEGSNVVAAESSVRLIHVMRQFEMLQKALLQRNEMGRRAIEQLASAG